MGKKYHSEDKSEQYVEVFLQGSDRLLTTKMRIKRSALIPGSGFNKWVIRIRLLFLVFVWMMVLPVF